MDSINNLLGQVGKYIYKIYNSVSPETRETFWACAAFISTILYLQYGITMQDLDILSFIKLDPVGYGKILETTKKWMDYIRSLSPEDAIQFVKYFLKEAEKNQPK